MRLPWPRAAVAMAAFLAGAGVTHFASPAFYDPMVPTQLPGPARFWVQASGVAQLGVAALVAVPRTRSTEIVLVADVADLPRAGRPRCPG